MSDRPTAANGKRNQAWGTTNVCPDCGECLCFACHPHGPCVDEHEVAARRGSARFSVASFSFSVEPDELTVRGSQL